MTTPAVIVAVVVLGQALDRPVAPLTSAFLAWDAYGIAYAVLTWRTFRTSSPATLPRLVRRDREVSGW